MFKIIIIIILIILHHIIEYDVQQSASNVIPSS
jgi:hypothetical protein